MTISYPALRSFPRLPSGFMSLRTDLFRRCLLSFMAILPAICSAEDQLHPFATDGCSLFPDRSLISPADWCKCCLAHDLAYWRGGSSDERLKADQELKLCVSKATGNEPLAELMFAGVRLGGGPYFFTSYRWGYGWAFGREYKSLTPEEEKKVSVLEKEYLATNPALSCPKPRVESHSGLIR